MSLLFLVLTAGPGIATGMYLSLLLQLVIVCVLLWFMYMTYEDLYMEIIHIPIWFFLVGMLFGNGWYYYSAYHPSFSWMFR